MSINIASERTSQRATDSGRDDVDHPWPKWSRATLTGNWREYRPVIDPEQCNPCPSCIAFCPDACWQLNAAEDEVVWNDKSCKGCLICVSERSPGALGKAYELDFPDGAVRLERPFQGGDDRWPRN